MRRTVILMILLFVCSGNVSAQTQDVKVPADTLTIQAEGTYETDPDLAKLNFQVSAQDKELRKAYDQAARAMQRIVQLAERNGLAKADVSLGALTVVPTGSYDEKKQRSRSYRVSGNITLRVRDFAKIGPLMDESIQDGITEFRSLIYTLEDEEGAKQKAVAEAMRRAEARARAALGNSRKLGPVRYVTVDVKQLAGIVRLEQQMQYAVMETITVSGSDSNSGFARKAPSFPLPSVSPDKMSVSASVQCVFQLQ